MTLLATLRTVSGDPPWPMPVMPASVSSLRVRGYTKPCYNVLEFANDEVKITRRYPFGGESVIAHFCLSTGEQYHRELEPPVQQRRIPAAHQGES